VQVAVRLAALPERPVGAVRTRKPEPLLRRSVNGSVEVVGKVFKTQTVRYNLFTMALYKYFDKSRGLFMTVNLNDQLI
jgi:hypothetical protein